MSPRAVLSETAHQARRLASCEALLQAVLVGGMLVWSYYPVLASLGQRWQTDPQYSHGFLVPVLAALAWWSLRRRPSTASAAPCWWGAVPLLAGVALWLTGAFFYFVWLDSLSVLPVLAGLSLLLGGWKSARSSWPAIALLVFMLPLPFQVEGALSDLLQALATRSSAYVLVILGFPAVVEGNVLLIGDLRLGVLEACNGLGLLSAFFALSATAALMAQRPWFDRVVVFLSAVPVAVLMNIVRVTATGVAFSYVHAPATQARLHDAAGWLMMPMALATLWLELWLLARLIVVPAGSGPVPLGAEANTWKAVPVPTSGVAAGTTSAP